MRDEVTRVVVGSLVIAGFFAALYFVMVLKIDAGVRDALLVLLGALGAKFSTVVDFVFGSSAGSKAKDKSNAPTGPG